MSTSKLRAWLTTLTPPQRCQYCASPATGLPLCTGCTRALPWNDVACPGCARPLAESALCGDCATRTPRFDSAWAAFRLETPVQQSIHHLKYRAGFLQAHTLGALMAARLTARGEALPSLILPVPLHATRLRARGYNQALEVARVIGQRTGIAVRANLAQRTRATKDQIGMSAADRHRNLRGAFVVCPAVQDQHVALLDDVMTTGATLAALAKACRRAGAARVEAWAIARVA